MSRLEASATRENHFVFLRNMSEGMSGGGGGGGRPSTAATSAERAASAAATLMNLAEARSEMRAHGAECGVLSPTFISRSAHNFSIIMCTHYKYTLFSCLTKFFFADLFRCFCIASIQRNIFRARLFESMLRIATSGVHTNALALAHSHAAERREGGRAAAVGKGSRLREKNG